MNGLFSKVRSFVSADKNRYQEGVHDLDLTYITERLIAMSFPAEGFESSYRNNIHEVARFLKEKHGGHFMLFNLCSERGYNYGLFDHQVQGWCGFADHHAPPLALVFRLCRAIDDWLHKHPKNVAVIHCKAGKGRTGTITSAYLMYCGLFGSATVALNYFAHRRSNNMFGVSSPAQRRYVQYSADVIANQDIPATPRLILQQVIMNCMPKLEVGATETASGDAGELVLEIHKKTRDKVTVHKAHVALTHGHETSKDAVIFTVNCMVQGDVQIDLYVSRVGLLGGKKMQKICFVQFHTTMCGDSTIVFPRSECDKAAFDKRFPPNFELCVSVEEVLQCSASYETQGEDDIVENVRAAKSRDGTSVFFASEYATSELWNRIREVRNFSSPLCEQIEKAGYLCKQGLTVRNWKERWFVLRGATLSYFKSPKNTTPNGVIQLESIYTVTLMRDKRADASQPYANSLVLRTELRDFVVCAANVIDLEEWAEAIHVAGAQLHQHDLMLMPEIGKLFVVILGAENLYCNAVGSEAFMRPSCVASLARQKYTTTAASGASPSFSHEVFEFNLHSMQTALQVTVWDEQPNLAPRYLGQISLPIAQLLQHSSPTALWYPLMKRTTISLVSGSLHLVVYYSANNEPPESSTEKIRRMANMTLFDNAATLSAADDEFVVLERSAIPRVDSDDFVVVDEEEKQ